MPWQRRNTPKTEEALFVLSLFDDREEGYQVMQRTAAPVVWSGADDAAGF